MADDGVIKITNLDLTKADQPETKKLFLYLTFTSPRKPEGLAVNLKVSRDGKKPPTDLGPVFRAPTAHKLPDGVTLWRIAVKPAKAYTVTVLEKHKAGHYAEVWKKQELGVDVVSPSNQGLFQAGAFIQEGPAIAVALNEVPVGAMTAAGATDAETIAAIVASIEQRLLDRDAFLTIWTTEHGRRRDTEPDEKDSLDEIWARLVSERLTFSPYGGPTIFYNRHSKDEHEFYRKILDDDDPAYPICGACQHIALFSAVARGFNTHFEAAGSATENFVMKGHKPWDMPAVPGAEWKRGADAKDGYGSTQSYLTRKDWSQSVPKHAVLLEQKVTSGSCFVSGVDHLFGEYRLNCPLPGPKVKTPTSADTYIIHSGTLYKLTYQSQIEAREQEYGPAVGFKDPNGVQLYTIGSGYLAGQNVKTSEAHIAAVLRVDRKNGRLQVLDTGGGLGRMDFGNPPLAMTPLGTSPTTQESLWASADAGFSMGGYAGHAIFPEASQAQLTAAIARLVKMRPLGLCQLVIFRRKTEAFARYKRIDVLWSSKLLRMDHDGQPLPMTTLLWSLRGHPAWTTFEARWIVYIPRGALAAHVEMSRTTSVAVMVERTYRGRIDKKTNKPVPVPRDRNLSSMDDLLHVAEFGSLPDGNGAMTGRGAERKSGTPLNGVLVYSLPWDRESGSVTLPANATLKHLR